MTPKQARQVLNAPANPDHAALKRAFRSAVKIAHPDHGGDAERLRRVIEAHEVLKAAEQNRADSLTAPRPQTDAVEALHISVTEALLGATRRVSLGGRTLQVTLPAGLRNGESLRLPRGSPGEADLLARVSIADEPRLSVRGDDLWLRVDTLGKDGRVEIDTPRGRRAVWLSRKIGSKRLLRLAGEGLPARAGRRAGDLIIRFEPSGAPVETPARQMLRRFAGTWATA